MISNYVPHKSNYSLYRRNKNRLLQQVHPRRLNNCHHITTDCVPAQVYFLPFVSSTFLVCLSFLVPTNGAESHYRFPIICTRNKPRTSFSRREVSTSPVNSLSRKNPNCIINKHLKTKDNIAVNPVRQFRVTNTQNTEYGALYII